MQLAVRCGFSTSATGRPRFRGGQEIQDVSLLDLGEGSALVEVEVLEVARLGHQVETLARPPSAGVYS